MRGRVTKLERKVARAEPHLVLRIAFPRLCVRTAHHGLHLVDQYQLLLIQRAAPVETHPHFVRIRVRVRVGVGVRRHHSACTTTSLRLSAAIHEYGAVERLLWVQRRWEWSGVV